MKNSVINFCILSIIICCGCQTKPPAMRNEQLAMSNELPNKQEKLKPQTSNIKAQNCPDNITVKNGETFQIKIHAVAGTGFTWHLGEATNLVSLNSKNEIVYEADTSDTTENNSPKVGGKKVQVLEFTAKNAGTGNLTLYYSRPWEKDKEPAEKCVIALEVKSEK